jgi:hypothetical protein
MPRNPAPLSDISINLEGDSEARNEQQREITARLKRPQETLEKLAKLEDPQQMRELMEKREREVNIIRSQIQDWQRYHGRAWQGEVYVHTRFVNCLIDEIALLENMLMDSKYKLFCPLSTKLTYNHFSVPAPEERNLWDRFLSLIGTDSQSSRQRPLCPKEWILPKEGHNRILEDALRDFT